MGFNRETKFVRTRMLQPNPNGRVVPRPLAEKGHDRSPPASCELEALGIAAQAGAKVAYTQARDEFGRPLDSNAAARWVHPQAREPVIYGHL